LGDFTVTSTFLTPKLPLALLGTIWGPKRSRSPQNLPRKWLKRAQNTHLHIVCGILCSLNLPREIRIHNIPLTRKIREIEKMCMEILAIVCSAAGHKIFIQYLTILHFSGGVLEGEFSAIRSLNWKNHFFKMYLTVTFCTYMYRDYKNLNMTWQF
jgi:hypothetical protein